ncbi:hypothetical protein [Novosphingobium sp. ST904]|uniref:hypothetical protein n=1 Tax=Novosphingobium sp. ST904 TaxID=1684385 RepID=UPI0006C8905B|nr:hypothetical protein [Novosphingobium sp. ST904]TCM37726.1 hypothetical protein EDF59_110122 [Novosphingobium sp. ST904]
MPTQLSQTGIVNAAAALLGSSERITSLDGRNKLAVCAAAHWGVTIRTLLVDHPWNFGIKRAKLNAGPPPAWGFERTFALPADCLRLLPSRLVDGREFFYDGEVEDGKILTNASAPLAVRYIASATIDNVQAWLPTFAKAATYALAEDMAEDLTGASGLSEQQSQKFEYWLKRARRVDGLESQRGNSAPIASRSRWLSSMRTPFNPYSD